MDDGESRKYNPNNDKGIPGRIHIEGGQVFKVRGGDVYDMGKRDDDLEQEARIKAIQEAEDEKAEARARQQLGDTSRNAAIERTKTLETQAQLRLQLTKQEKARKEKWATALRKRGPRGLLNRIAKRLGSYEPPF